MSARLGFYPFVPASPQGNEKTPAEKAKEAENELICKIKIDNALRQFNEMLANLSLTYEQAIIQMQQTLHNEDLETGTVLTLKINEEWKRAQQEKLKKLQIKNDSAGITKLYRQAKKTISSCAIHHLDHARTLNARALSKKITFKSSNDEEKTKIQQIIEKIIKNESLFFQKRKHSKEIKVAKDALKKHQFTYLEKSGIPLENPQNYDASSVIKIGSHYAFDWSHASKELFSSSAQNLADEHYSLLVDLFQQIDSPAISTENKRIFLNKVKKVFSSWTDSYACFLKIKNLNIDDLSPQEVEENYAFFSAILNEWREEKHIYADNNPTSFTAKRTPLGGLSAQTSQANDSRNLWRVDHTITDLATNQNTLAHHTYRHANISNPKLIKKDPTAALAQAKKAGRRDVERTVADELQVNENFFRQEDGSNVYDLVSVSLQGGGIGSKKICGKPIGWNTADEKMNMVQKEAYESLSNKMLEVNGQQFKANVICFAFASNESSACYQGNNTERYQQNLESFRKLLQLIPKKLPVKDEVDRDVATIQLTQNLLELFEAQLQSPRGLPVLQREELTRFLIANFKVSPDQGTRVVQLIQDLGSLLTDRFAYRQNCPNEAPAKLDLLFAEINAISRASPGSQCGQMRQTTNCKSAKDRTSRADAATTAFFATRAEAQSKGPFNNYCTYREFQENPTERREFFQKRVAEHEHRQLGIISFSNLYGATGSKYVYNLAILKVVHAVFRRFGTGEFWAAPESNTIFASDIKN